MQSLALKAEVLYRKALEPHKKVYGKEHGYTGCYGEPRVSRRAEKDEWSLEAEGITARGAGDLQRPRGRISAYFKQHVQACMDIGEEGR